MAFAEKNNKEMTSEEQERLEKFLNDRESRFEVGGVGGVVGKRGTLSKEDYWNYVDESEDNLRKDNE